MESKSLNRGDTMTRKETVTIRDIITRLQIIANNRKCPLKVSSEIYKLLDELIIKSR